MTMATYRAGSSARFAIWGHREFSGGVLRQEDFARAEGKEHGHRVYESNAVGACVDAVVERILQLRRKNYLLDQPVNIFRQKATLVAILTVLAGMSSSLSSIETACAAGALAWAYNNKTHEKICLIETNDRDLQTAESVIKMQCDNARGVSARLRDRCSRSVNSFTNQCAACAWPKKGRGFGKAISVRGTLEEAKIAAAHECLNTGGTNCLIKKRGCDGNAS
jgi:hypothetical protein